MENNYKKQPFLFLTIAFSCLLGLVLGVYLYGGRVAPSYTEWMMHNDVATYYLSWLFLRTEPWTFPLGEISGYTYPQISSIVFSDAVPIVAIIVKLFDSILPAGIQYHGALSVANFVFQGLFAALLIRYFTHSLILQILGACMFILVPSFILRSDGHIPVAFHWILLAATYLYLHSFNKQTMLKWLLLLTLAVGVNFYMFTMSLSIYFAFLFKTIILDYKSNLYPVIAWLIITIIAVFTIMYSIGYFVVDAKQAESREYGIYSFNPLSFFRPIINGRHDFFPSLFIASFSSPNNGQYEGYNYPGAGNLFLLFCTLFYIKFSLSSLISKKYIPLLLLSVFLLVFSISHYVVIGNQVLFDFKLPEWLFNKLSIFRASGRFFWVVVYFIILFSLVVIVKKLSQNKAIILLSFVIVLQITDIAPKLVSINKQFGFDSKKVSWINPLLSPDWNFIFPEYKHIFLIPAKHVDDYYVPLALYAVRNNMTFNAGYLARVDKAAQLLQTEDFLSGNLQEETIYIFRGKDLPPQLANDDSIIKGYLDNYLIVAPGFKNIEMLRDFKRI